MNTPEFLDPNVEAEKYKMNFPFTYVTSLRPKHCQPSQPISVDSIVATSPRPLVVPITVLTGPKDLRSLPW